MGLARRDRGARRRRCGASATPSNDELARNPHAPSGFRRRAGICGVAAPRQCPALPASRRLASAGTALGTRPMLLLGQAPRGRRAPASGVPGSAKIPCWDRMSGCQRSGSRPSTIRASTHIDACPMATCCAAGTCSSPRAGSLSAGSSKAGTGSFPVLVNEASRRALEPSLSALPDGIPAYVCDTGDFASITGFNLHRGCLALAERPADRPFPDLIQGCDRLLILEGVTDADNVGSAFRNAAAFGARVLLSPSCCDPLYRKAIRTSMGSAFRTPYTRLTNWPGDLDTLKAEGFTVVALTPRPPSIDLASCARVPRVALLVGTEGPGLSEAAERVADVRARIPIRRDVDSLNLATATGIALHHFSSARPQPSALSPKP